MLNTVYKSYAFLFLILLSFTTTVYSKDDDSCNSQQYQKAKSLIDSYQGKLLDLKIAYEVLTESLEDNPNCATVYRQLARISMKAGVTSVGFQPGVLENAESQLKKSISIDSDFSDAYVLLSSVYIHMRDYKNAKSNALRALELGSNSPWLTIRMAEIAEAEKNYNKAEEYYLQLVNSELKSDYEVRRAIPSAKEGLISLYLSRKYFDKADKYYQDIIQEEGSAWSHGNYASFLLNYRGDYERAILEAEKALKVMNYGAARHVLATSLYLKWADFLINKNESDKAQTYFNRAYSLYPNINRMRDENIRYKNTALLGTTLTTHGKEATDKYQSMVKK